MMIRWRIARYKSPFWKIRRRSFNRRFSFRWNIRYRGEHLRYDFLRTPSWGAWLRTRLTQAIRTLWTRWQNFQYGSSHTRRWSSERWYMRCTTIRPQSDKRVYSEVHPTVQQYGGRQHNCQRLVTNELTCQGFPTGYECWGIPSSIEKRFEQ
jgi:hypothetical protein